MPFVGVKVSLLIDYFPVLSSLCIFTDSTIVSTDGDRTSNDCRISAIGNEYEYRLTAIDFFFRVFHKNFCFFFLSECKNTASFVTLMMFRTVQKFIDTAGDNMCIRKFVCV